MTLWKYHCSECDTFFDLTVNPPRILDAKNYSLLFTKMGQSDIALIKSVLDDANIDYYVYDERFFGREIPGPAC